MDTANAFTLYCSGDGTVALCATARDRRGAFDNGFLPVASFRDADEFARHGRPLLQEVAGRWYLTEAMDRPLSLDDLFAIRERIERAKATPE